MIVLCYYITEYLQKIGQNSPSPCKPTDGFSGIFASFAEKERKNCVNYQEKKKKRTVLAEVCQKRCGLFENRENP